MLMLKLLLWQIQKSIWNSYKYYAGCSYYCFLSSRMTAYCNSNSCNTVSLISSADSISISKRFATLAVLFAVVIVYFKKWNTLID